MYQSSKHHVVVKTISLSVCSRENPSDQSDSQTSVFIDRSARSARGRGTSQVDAKSCPLQRQIRISKDQVQLDQLSSCISTFSVSFPPSLALCSCCSASPGSRAVFSGCFEGPEPDSLAGPSSGASSPPVTASFRGCTTTFAPLVEPLPPPLPLPLPRPRPGVELPPSPPTPFVDPAG